ncbi:DUF5134 domain-containing protein [Nocardia abscessus]|uniref:DUF5134 domain-containing protein n=1 Tax=Nocardia abscessus TaxID=120957 RepID=UPI001896349A|nr:DUF5134 domain-containing protein [Nocardia abscessus]MBF6335566.1 DUF5134 domain-containing protein [Nocardia abscessus]
MHHSGLPPAVNWAMIVLCVGGAAVAAAGFLGSRTAARRLDRYGGQGSELFHLVMLAAMAVMGNQWSEALSATRWRQLFGALAIASLLWLIAGTRGRPGEREHRIGAALYHCVAALSMVYATLGSPTAASGHAHHAATDHTADLPCPMLGWLLAGVFLLDALVAAAAVIRPPGGVESTRRRLVVTVFPHLAMDIAMTAMLVASLA